MTYVEDCPVCGETFADDAEHDHSADAVVIRDGARGQYLAPTFALDVHDLTGAVPADVREAADLWLAGMGEPMADAEPTEAQRELVLDFTTYGGPAALDAAGYVDVHDDGYVIYRAGGAESGGGPIALASLSVYVILGRDAPNVEGWPATDDPDEHADAILRGLSVEPELSWRQSGGDDHGDGLTSYDYVAELPDADALAAFLRWIGAEPGEGTPNLGILTGPEEWGHIPAGMTWSMEGMDWNLSGVTRYAAVDAAIFPITLPAYVATFGEAPGGEPR